MCNNSKEDKKVIVDELEKGEGGEAEEEGEIKGMLEAFLPLSHIFKNLTPISIKYSSLKLL